VEQSLAAANKKAADAEAALAIATAAAQRASKEAQDAAIRLQGLPPAQPANCSKKIQYTKADIRPYVVADAEDRAAVSQLQANVDAWVNHSLIPIQFSALLTGMADQDRGLIGLQGFCGELIWNRFYPDTKVKLTDYVPMQLASILNANFIKLDKETKQMVATKAAGAVTTFDELDIQDTADLQERRGAYQPW
jgi:hypothetical protein